MTASPRGRAHHNDRPPLLELADRLEAPTVSLFTEWGRGGEGRANEIRTRHCVSMTGERLQSWGASDERRRAMQDAIEERLVEIEMGTAHDHLALFTDGENTELWPLPAGPSELVHVAERPFVRPLLPLVQRNRSFLVLELALRDPHLYLGTWLTFEKTSTDLPKSFEEVVGGETESQGVQFRTQQAISSPSALYHGHGGGHDDVVPELEQYLHEIDKRLRDEWGSSGLPLVLAGVERERGHFRKVSDYEPIVDGELPLVRESEASAEASARLHQKAVALFEEQWRREHRAELGRLRGHLDGDGRVAAGGLENLLIDAYAGQLTRLYLLRDENVWGRFDPTSGEVTKAEAHSGDCEELLNHLALVTLESRGQVFELSREDLEETDLAELWPQGEPAVALERGT
ncbi:MAG TPA: hypothetical protein VMT85_23805 [Thermoanaerobaculia bacterium]|nr:hypothetical protein [Thermoanaerobaculia bacterium]